MQTHAQTQSSYLKWIILKTMQMPPPGASTVTYKIIGSSVKKMLFVLKRLHPTSHLHFTKQQFWSFACPSMGSMRRFAHVHEIIR